MEIEYNIIKTEDDFCSSVDSLNNLLMSNSKVKISNNSLTFDSIITKYQVSTRLVGEQKERLFRIILSNEDKDPEKCILALEKASHIFRKILKESGRDFKINIIWDEVSQYYCKLSYPLLNKIENQMRKLIFRFMIENIGSDWVEKSIPKDVLESLKQNAERSKKKSLIENCLYEADFIHLIQFMFTPYSTISSTKDLFEKLDKIKSMKEINELKELKPLSNWDRYFSALIKFEKLDEKWTELYLFRNKIAHNNLLIRADYEKLLKLSAEISECLEKALSELDKIKVPEVAKETIRKVAIRSIEIGFAYISPNLSSFPCYSGPIKIGDPTSVLGFSDYSPYLSGAAVCLDDLSLGYKSKLGVETGVCTYSLLSSKICSQCGQVYTPNSTALTILNKCPECEQGGLLNLQIK